MCSSCRFGLVSLVWPYFGGFLTYRHFSNYKSDFDAVKSKVGLLCEMSKTNLCLKSLAWFGHFCSAWFSLTQLLSQPFQVRFRCFRYWLKPTRLLVNLSPNSAQVNRLSLATLWFGLVWMVWFSLARWLYMLILNRFWCSLKQSWSSECIDYDQLSVGWFGLGLDGFGMGFLS